ncbi:hypothetical protein EES37_20600 [Streptomyces sp. ADI91-18]|nr:hypothetical protein EES37_20600 [Streptomyces sp. ADI91-18]
MPDVGFDRAEQQRPVRRPVLAVGGQQRLRLDRVAQGRTGAVRLDDVHLGRRQTGVGERLVDDALLRGAVGRGQAVAGAVLVDRGAADHGEDRVSVALGVRQALHEQHADAFAPAGAVGCRREGLAAAVGGQPALAAELGEGGRGGHHGDTAGEGHGALPRPQGLYGQVQGDEGGGAGGVDGDGGAFEAEGVRHAAGGDAAGAAGAEEALDAFGYGVQAGGVVVVHHAGEDGRPAAAQGGRVDAGALEGLPGGLQEEPLVRVHGEGLARGDPEGGGVEAGGVVEEAALADVAGSGAVGVGVVERLHVPAAVGRESGDRVGAVGDEPPQVLGGADAARVAAAHRDDRDGFLVLLLYLAQPPAGLAQIGGCPLEVVAKLVFVHHVRGSMPERRSYGSVRGGGSGCRAGPGAPPGVLRRRRVRRRAGRRARRRTPCRGRRRCPRRRPCAVRCPGRRSTWP